MIRALELINDTQKRADTFQRRKQGILKKAVDLSTLCDINVSMIIFNDQYLQTPEIFQTDIDLINLYKKLGTTDPKKIKSHDFSRNNMLERAKKGNLRPKYPTWLEFLNDYSEKSLREFGSVLEDKSKKVKTRIESFKKRSDFGNLDKVNSDSMMTEEDFNNLGINIEELFGDKSSLESIMSETKDDCKYWYDCENFGLDQTDQLLPKFEFCFSPEETMQPESSSCYMEMMKEFVTPSLPSHVMDYITGSDYL